LGIGLGIKTDAFDFDLAGPGNGTFALRHSSVFAVIDASALKINAGYIFDSRELYNDTVVRNTGQGFFIAVEAMYRF
jgi:hypothetical protein